MVPDSFFASVKKQSCVLYSWSGGDYASSFSVIVIILVECSFFCSCLR